jgi:hypothetical protein
MASAGTNKNIGVGRGSVNAAEKQAGKAGHWPFGNPAGMAVAVKENGSL